MIDRNVMLGSAPTMSKFALPIVHDAPTQVSCLPEYPGHEAWAALMADNYIVNIFLDGVDQSKGFVEAADSERGWVRRLKMSPEGNPMISGDEYIVEEVFGRVTIQAVKRKG